MRKTNFFQISILITAGLILWLVFYPGTFSYDSLHQYGQAQAWNFNDWHPPLMAVTLGIVLRLGGGVGLLTLFTCLLGTLGVRALLIELRCPPRTATVAALCFLLPINPLPFYLVTFWKDTWIAVALLWLAAGIIRLGKSADFPTVPAIAIILLAGLFPSIRHNALLVLPPVSLCLWLASHQITRRSRLLLALAPLLIAGIAALCWHSLLGVRKTFIGNWLKEKELTTFCDRYPNQCDFPYSKQYISGGLGLPAPKGHFEIGTLWGGKSPYGPDPELDRDYQRAIRQYPLLMARVKLRHFRQALQPCDDYRFHATIDANEFGLAPLGVFSEARAVFIQVGQRAADSLLGRHFLYHHFVWFAIAHLLALVLLLTKRWLYFGLTLLPLAYYYSYLPAATVTDYRLMYPGALLIHVALVAIALSTLDRLQFAPQPHLPPPHPPRLFGNSESP